MTDFDPCRCPMCGGTNTQPLCRPITVETRYCYHCGHNYYVDHARRVHELNAASAAERERLAMVTHRE